MGKDSNQTDTRTRRGKLRKHPNTEVIKTEVSQDGLRECNSRIRHTDGQREADGSKATDCDWRDGQIQT